MAVITCWSSKAGSGTTVVAAALALAARRPAVAVDLDGDLVATLGIDEPRGQGLHDWLADPTAPPESLASLTVPVTSTLAIVPAGGTDVAASTDRWDELTAHLAADDDIVWIVDGGATPPPALLAPGPGRRHVLVQRACYVALRRTRLARPSADAVVFVQETGRALNADDVAAVLGTPVTATLAVDPKIGRAIDAGTLPRGMPGRVLAALRPLTELDRFDAGVAEHDDRAGADTLIRPGGWRW